MTPSAIAPATGRSTSDRMGVVTFVALLAASTLAYRFPILGQSASVFDITLLAALLPAAWLIRRHGLPELPKPYLRLAIAMIVLPLVSILWSVQRLESALFAISSIESLVAFVVALMMLRGVRSETIALLAGAWLVLLIIPGILLWLRVPGFGVPAEFTIEGGYYWSYFARLSHPLLGRSNNLATLLVVLVPAVTLWGFRRRNWLILAMGSLGFLGVILTLSRGVLLALVVVAICGAAYGLARGRRVRPLPRVAWLWLGANVALAVVIVALVPAVRSFLWDRFSLASIVERGGLVAQGWSVVAEHWLLGAGAGTGNDIHNTFLQQLVYFGVPLGLLVDVLLVATVVWWFRGQAVPARWLALAAGFGVSTEVLSFVSQSSFEGTLLRPLIWLGWGLLVAWVASMAQDVPQVIEQHAVASSVDSVGPAR